jgi:hypothetical protein
MNNSFGLFIAVTEYNGLSNEKLSVLHFLLVIGRNNGYKFLLTTTKSRRTDTSLFFTSQYKNG